MLSFVIESSIENKAEGITDESVNEEKDENMQSDNRDFSASAR